jgi:hypothetical protein
MIPTTAAPLATATSTLPPPTNTATAVPDPLHTACDHPYWPLRLGAAWQTRLGDGVRTLTVTEVIGDLTNATTTLAETDPDGTTVSTEVICDANGSRYGNLTLTQPDGHTGIQTVIAYSGTHLIAADLFAIGATWAWSQTADFDWPVYEGGTYTGQATYSNTAAQTCTAKGEEEITVAAGTFTGIRVECVGTIVWTDATGEWDPVEFITVFVYVEELGPINLALDRELLSYTIP